ncbi:MAG: hypothetical protein OXT06_02655 [Rhodospirillaceae bacterium]|nr:hypothetical protein [Rhodospirillaceae bacterium]
MRRKRIGVEAEGRDKQEKDPGAPAAEFRHPNRDDEDDWQKPCEEREGIEEHCLGVAPRHALVKKLAACLDEGPEIKIAERPQLVHLFFFDAEYDPFSFLRQVKRSQHRIPKGKDMPEVGVVMLGAVRMMDLMLRGRNEDPVPAIV